MTEATRVLQRLPVASRRCIEEMRAVNAEVWALLWEELYGMDVRLLAQLRVTQLSATHLFLELPGAHLNLTNDCRVATQ